jgi:hypothetical protein
MVEGWSLALGWLGFALLILTLACFLLRRRP